MAIKIGSLYGDVSLRQAGFDKGIKGIQKSLGSLGKSMSSIGKQLSLKLTAPLAGLGAASVAAFNKQAEAEASLRAALSASGEEVAMNLYRIKQLGSEIQKVTTVGDETSIALAQLGISMGLSSDKVGDALKGAIGLSASFGVSLQTAMRMSAGALQGQTEMLTRYIPELKNVQDQSGKVALVQEKMANGFKLAQEKAKVGSGPLKQLAAAISDLMEPIGKVITEAINPWIGKLKQLVENFSQKLTPAMIKVGVAVGALAAIIGPFLVVLGTLSITISAISVPLLLVVSGLVAFGAALYAAWEFGEHFVGPWMANLYERVISVKDLVVEVARALKETLVDGFRSVVNYVSSSVMQVLGHLWSKLTSIWDLLKKVLNQAAALNPLRSAGESLGNMISNVAFRAKGGPVTAGRPYIVGEMGPELFVPSFSGNIISNNNLPGITVHQTFDGNLDLAVVTALKNMKPMLTKWAVEGVREHHLRHV